MVSSRNLTSTPVLSPVVVLATTPSSTHIACCGSTTGAVASLSDWWPTQTMSAAGVMVRLGPFKWMSTAPCLLWSLPRWCIGDMMCSGECCDSAIVARCCMAWGKFRKLLPVLTAWPLSPRIRGRCTRHVFTLISSTAAKRWDQITLNCSDSAAMTLSWPAGFVSLKTETKHPQLHYYRNMTLRILRLSFTVSHSDGMDMYSGPGPVSILSQTFWFLVLDSKEGLWRRGLDVWRLIQVFVAWLTLAHKTEMHGEPVFDMAWCCQSHGDTEWDTDSTLI